jgi:type VI secretion system ImpA family protein
MATLSKSPPIARRAIPELEAFLKNISPESPAGTYLRYESIYDDVRHSRQEDDPRLSMGIWKTDLKKADWNKIESLCIEALTTKSKDLQISVWLTEAWTCLDGIEGYIRGTQITSELSKAFWPVIYPLPQDDGDMENRSMIFEWMDTTLSNRLLMVPLTQSRLDQTTYGLGYYKSAQFGDAAQRRVDQGRMQTTDPSKAIGTVEDFQRSMEQTPDTFLITQQMSVEKAIESTQTFKNTLSELLGSEAPSCTKVFGILKEMDRILRTTLQTRQPPEPEPAPEPTPVIEEPPPVAEPSLEAPDQETPDMPVKAESPPVEQETIPSEEETTPPEVSVTEHLDEEEAAPTQTPEEATQHVEETHTSNNLKTREDAYLQLEAIASFLEQTDPHSLAPQLIRQLIRWENKNIVEVLAEIAKTPQEFEILMRIIGNPSVKE